jgi:anti-sigma regulatory factor (Ser/Thr protein kinase)
MLGDDDPPKGWETYPVDSRTGTVSSSGTVGGQQLAVCTETADVLTVLEPNARAPGQARRMLARMACATHNAALLETAQLLVSELVTNALIHGRPPITLQISCAEQQGLQVDVSDTDPDLPVIQPRDVRADHGRGVALVDLLSDDCGVQPADPGKRVWFRLKQRDAGT